MLASISEGTTCIKNLLMGNDCLRTIEAFRAMGVKIRFKVQGSRLKANDVIVDGVGMRGLRRPLRPLYLGNSGTTMRILPGILAGQDFQVVLKGDRSLSGRPMQRIVEPLKRMGASILTSQNKHCRKCEVKEAYPPLKIHGGELKPIRYKSNIASAQVKSCILLAGLFARGATSVTEPVKSRDHTERMLEIFGCRLKAQGLRVSLKGPVRLKSPGTVEIPGDISSAAFFIVAACILPQTKIIIKNAGLNPTRTGVLDILKRMRAEIKIKNQKSKIKGYEPVGNIIVKSSKLKGVTISPKEVAMAIDEIPVIMVAASLAKGTTIIQGIDELRVKETDRVKSMVTNLRKLGARISVVDKVSSGEAVIIHGGTPLYGARVLSFGDHRTAMSMLVAGLVAKGKTTVIGLGCISKSFPGFENSLRKLN